jgi:hypothetical protein
MPTFRPEFFLLDSRALQHSIPALLIPRMDHLTTFPTPSQDFPYASPIHLDDVDDSK